VSPAPYVKDISRIVTPEARRGYVPRFADVSLSDR
jgi:hypothetical protein